MNKNILIVVAILIGLASYLYLSNNGKSNLNSEALQLSAQPTLARSNKELSSLNLTRQYVEEKLKVSKIEVIFHPEMNKYMDDSSKNVLTGDSDKILVSLIGPEDNLIQISYSGELTHDKDINNNTLAKMYQLTDVIDPEITKWFIATSLEFDKTISSGSKKSNIINGRNVEISYTFDSDAKAFNAPGYIFVIITGAHK